MGNELSEAAIDANYDILASLVTEHCYDFAFLLSKLKDLDDALGLKYAPAGVGIHHAYKGGLVVHYLEMWAIHLQLHTADVDCGKFDKGEVLRAIILHDLHKAYYCFGLSDDDTGAVVYLNSLHNTFASNNMLSLYLAILHGCNITPLVLNSLCNAEGGWAKDPSKVCSSFAKYIYTLDELSSNVRSTENEELNLRASKYKCKARDLDFSVM